jgi:hypothetical protein
VWLKGSFDDTVKAEFWQKVKQHKNKILIWNWINNVYPDNGGCWRSTLFWLVHFILFLFVRSSLIFFISCLLKQN